MKLYGSLPSPFVRRIRMYADGLEHEFISMDIFAQSDRDILRAKNPTLKVPMLEDDDNIVFDSNLIQQYLEERYRLPGLSYSEKNVLVNINALNDSLVNMLMLSRSDIDTSADLFYFNVQRERLEIGFADLEKQAATGSFNKLPATNYLAISLFCLLDWADFRNLYDISKFPSLHEFRLKFAALDIAVATDPRQ